MKIINKTLKLILASAIFVLFTYCEKDNDTRQVTYLLTGLEQDFQVSYINEQGKTINDNIEPVNDDAVWTYSFDAQKGDILYLYIRFLDTDLDPTKFKFRILINGKVYKDAYGCDKEDTETIPISYVVKRAGTVPY